MHRGSSKGDGETPPPETLPLSASGALIRVRLELVRAGRTTPTELDVPRGTPVRKILRSAGHAPEGCAVLVAGVPCPLDRPLESDIVLTVVSTFSGG